MKLLLKIFSCLLPWSLKRRVLNACFGFQIHPKAYIGFAWVFPRKLIMSEGARIDHFTIAIHLDLIDLGMNATIGRSNWITGFPTNTESPHFSHQKKRQAALLVRESASITKNHHLDCTNLIEIGRFTTIAGYDSQLLTHSINITEGRQDSAPIYIGEYSFVGTNVVILGGSILPSFTVLGAKSLLNKPYSNEWTLYGGVPAKPINPIQKSSKYFQRTLGFVH